MSNKQYMETIGLSLLWKQNKNSEVIATQGFNRKIKVCRN